MAERSTQFTVSGSRFTETADNFAGSSFAQEVSLINHSCIDGQEPWYLLPHTGFNIRLQIDQLERDLERGYELGKTAGEILEENFPKIEQDIQGFKTEYLCQGLLFPIVLDTKLVDGRRRLVAPLYNSKLFIKTVSEQERQGTVKPSLIRVEDFLLEAPPGSIAIMTSPPGPSGFEDITYLDSQTYIWQVQEDGKPRGFTIRTDMSLEENRRLLISLGIDEKHLSADSLENKLARIAANPVFIRHDQGQREWTVEDVIDIIQFIKRSDFAYNSRQFSEIYEELQNPQCLWTLDETTKRLTDELKTFFLEQLASDRYARQDLEIALGITVLKLAREIRTYNRHQLENSISHFSNLDSHISRAISSAGYLTTLAQIQQLPGCHGGGTTSNQEGYISTGTISSRHAEISTSGEKTLNCICPFCKNKVEAIISNGRITCPQCHSSTPYEC